MWKYIVLAASLTFMGATQAQSQELQLVEGRSWVNFGADPAYASLEEAQPYVARDMMVAGYSEEFSEIMQQAVNGQPGTPCQVDNEDRLTFMRSGDDELWLDVNVEFRSSPEPNMDYSAPGLCWTATDGETIFTFIIPYVCFNNQGMERSVEIREVRVEAPRPDCVDLWFPAQVGNEIHGAVIGETRLLADECLEANDGFQDITLANPCMRDCDWDDTMQALQRAWRQGDQEGIVEPTVMAHDFSFTVGDKNLDGQISEADMIDWTGDGVADSLNGEFDCRIERPTVMVRISMSPETAASFYFSTCQICAEEPRRFGRTTVHRTMVSSTEPPGQFHMEHVSEEDGHERDDWHVSPITGNLTAYIESCEFSGAADCVQDRTR